MLPVQRRSPTGDRFTGMRFEKGLNVTLNSVFSFQRTGPHHRRSLHRNDLPPPRTRPPRPGRPGDPRTHQALPPLDHDRRASYDCIEAVKQSCRTVSQQPFVHRHRCQASRTMDMEDGAPWAGTSGERVHRGTGEQTVPERASPGVPDADASGVT